MILGSGLLGLFVKGHNKILVLAHWKYEHGHSHQAKELKIVIALLIATFGGKDKRIHTKFMMTPRKFEAKKKSNLTGCSMEVDTDFERG